MQILKVDYKVYVAIYYFYFTDYVSIKLLKIYLKISQTLLLFLFQFKLMAKTNICWQLRP